MFNGHVELIGNVPPMKSEMEEKGVMIRTDTVHRAHVLRGKSVLRL